MTVNRKLRRFPCTPPPMSISKCFSLDTIHYFLISQHASSSHSQITNVADWMKNLFTSLKQHLVQQWRSTATMRKADKMCFYANTTIPSIPLIRWDNRRHPCFIFAEIFISIRSLIVRANVNGDKTKDEKPLFGRFSRVQCPQYKKICSLLWISF